MNKKQKEQTAWMLMRERFHIANKRPPNEPRKEREMCDILSAILEQEQPTPSLSDQEKETWRAAVGSQIANHTFPESFTDGILMIHVDHPGWLAEVRRLPKQPILKKLNGTHSFPNVRDIVFRLDPALRTKGVRKQKNVDPGRRS